MSHDDYKKSQCDMSLLLISPMSHAESNKNPREVTIFLSQFHMSYAHEFENGLVAC